MLEVELSSPADAGSTLQVDTTRAQDGWEWGWRACGMSLTVHGADEAASVRGKLGVVDV